MHGIDRTRLVVSGLRLAMLLLAVCAPGPAALAAPAIGILQFQVEHNLETPDCLAAGDCALQVDPSGDPSAWLGEIASHSNLAVLHWDRAVPWLVFDIDAPPGVDRVAFYDAALDAPTRGWLDSFAAHFAAMGRGYLAVSLLAGQRDRLEALHVDATTRIGFTQTCPDFSPGSQHTIDPGSGPVSFDLERSYRNFLLYLGEKLEPDWFALLVEVNIIEATCPTRAEGLYALYRALHDQVELTLGPNAPLLFATLSYPHLLGYSREACYPTSTFQPCATPPGPSAPDAGVDACFPVDRSAIDALDLGGRLDVLALSFYPDALEMRLAAGDAPESRAWPLADWNAGGACFGRLDWPDAVDPIAAIDRLGWTGPVGLAEVSVRSCPSPLRIDLPLPSGPPDPWVFEIAGSPAAQSAWVEHMLREANARDFLFYNHSFLRDYPPLGTWLVDEGILTAELQALFNLWPCSGLQDAAGLLKPELAGIVVPEPAPAEVAWVVVIGVAAAGARRALWQTRAVARGTGPTEGGIGIDGGSTRRRTRPEAGCASPHADG